MLPLLLAASLASAGPPQLATQARCSSFQALLGPDEAPKFEAQTGLSASGRFSITVDGSDAVMRSDIANEQLVRASEPDLVLDPNGRTATIRSALPPVAPLFLGTMEHRRLPQFQDAPATGCAILVVLNTAPLRLQALTSHQPFPITSDVVAVGMRWGDRPDTVDAGLFGEGLLGDELVADALRGERARRPALGRSTTPPSGAFRVNGDPVTALHLAFQVKGGETPANFDAILDSVVSSGVRFAPGTEFAVFLNGSAAPDVLFVAPLRRPRSSARVMKELRKLAQTNNALRVEGDLVLFGSGDKQYALGGGRGTVVLGSSAALVHGQLAGTGAPWFTNTAWLHEPGLYFVADPSSSMFEALDLPDGMPAFAFHAHAEDDDSLWLSVSAGGGGAWFRDAVQEDMKRKLPQNTGEPEVDELDADELHAPGQRSPKVVP